MKKNGCGDWGCGQRATDIGGEEEEDGLPSVTPLCCASYVVLGLFSFGGSEGEEWGDGREYRYYYCRRYPKVCLKVRLWDRCGVVAAALHFAVDIRKFV